MRVSPGVYSREYYLTECGGWEDWQKTYGEKIEPRLSYPLALAKIKPGMQVLDFGCGRGELTWHAAQLGAHALGMDYSAAALQLTQHLPPLKKGSIKFVHNTQLKLDLPSDSIDRIFFVDVLEHLYPKQLQTLLPEFYRVLKTGGQVIVHTAPNREYYEYGYPWYTRWVSVVINPLYWLVFGERLVTRADPRRPYDHRVHINEATLQEVREFFTGAKFRKLKLWYSSKFRDIRVRDHLRYAFLQPQWGGLKRWFCYDIWGIITK